MTFVQSDFLQIVLFLTLLFSSLSVSVVRAVKTHPSYPSRLNASLLAPSLISMFFLVFYMVQWAIFKEQSWIRLERTLAWAKGFPLYPNVETGVVMTGIYGPVSSWVYWPAAWFSSPFDALRMGQLIALLLFFLPVFWLLLQSCNMSDRRFQTAGSLLCFCFFALSTVLTSLKEAAYTIHADAPALGFGALACGILYFMRPETVRFRTLLLSAFFTMLAIGSKQTAVPLVAALPAYLFFAHGKRIFFQYVAALVVTGTALGLLFLFLFDDKSMVYHMLVIPSRHSMKETDLVNILKHLWRLGRECLLILLVSLPATIPAFREFKNRKSFREWFMSHPWILFAITAFLMAPLALLSHMKIGGSNNTLSFVTYYLLIAVTLVFVSEIRKAKEPILGRLKTAIGIYTLILFVVTSILVVHRLSAYDKQPNFANQAYQYILEHPEEAYFPRLTVLNLIAEGQLYHAADGLMDRNWASIPVSQEQFYAHLPKKLKIVAFSGENHRNLLPLGDDFSAGYVNQYEQLPSFVVYPKKDSQN